MHAAQHSQPLFFRLCQKSTAPMCKSRVKKLPRMSQRDVDRVIFATRETATRVRKESVRSRSCPSDRQSPMPQERATSEVRLDGEPTVPYPPHRNVLNARAFTNQTIPACGTERCGQVRDPACRASGESLGILDRACYGLG
jgi:hypothetical protein